MDMNKDRTRSLQAGTELKPVYGEGLPDLHVDTTHNEMPSAGQPAQQGSLKLRSIMQDLSYRGMRNRTPMDSVKAPEQEPAPENRTHNPHKRQTEATVARQERRQSEAEAADEAKISKSLPGRKTVGDRAVQITRKVENDKGVHGKKEIVPDRPTQKRGLERPSHFNLSREARARMAEAALGSRVEAIAAKAAADKEK